MELYISSVNRGENYEEASRIYRVDPFKNEIKASVRLPLAMFDLTNPRGGTRGSRGITQIKSRRLFAAGFDGIFELDPDDLFILKGAWFREIMDIHGLYSNSEDNLIAVSSWNNSIFEVDNSLSGKVKKLYCLTDKFPDPYISNTPDQYHLNSLCPGHSLGILNRQGVICNYETEEIILSYPEGSGPHDLVWIKDNLFATCISAKRQVALLELNKGAFEIVLDLGSNQPKVIPPNKINMLGWTRGLSYSLDHDILCIGASPGRVIGIHLSSRETVFDIQLSDRSSESVFGVEIAT